MRMRIYVIEYRYLRNTQEKIHMLMCLNLSKKKRFLKIE